MPAALRGKGLDGPGRQQLNYSGPDEAGAPANQGGRGGGRSGGTANTGGNQAGRSQGGNRKDRRAAARAQSKRDRRG